MGTKYSSQSIVGYNASPPADDGSAVEANKVKWATHKTKLTDPVKVLAEAVDTALIAYVDTQPNLRSTAYTTTANDHNKIIQTTGTTTITLGAVTTMGTGYTVTVKNAGVGTVTVDGSGAEAIDGQATIMLSPNESITCVVDNASGEYLAQAGYKNEFAAGTLMLFQQTNAPTGWTKQTTHNDKALRVVTAPTAGSGGTNKFSTVFNTPTTASYTLLIADIPSHSHGLNSAVTVGTGSNIKITGSGTNDATGLTGGDGGHSHDLTMDIQYVDLIIASRD